MARETYLCSTRHGVAETNPTGSPQLSVFYSPREHQDVHGYERKILVEQSKKGHRRAYCIVCSRVKAEHQKPAGLLQPLPISEWKWESIGMDFITGLPKTRSGYDSIWVIVNRLTKVAHFIPVKTTYTSAKLAKIYMNRIVCLHGVPKSIVSDRGTQFTSHFWRQLHESLGTRLEFSSAFYP